jgi:hypothetical protein
MVPNMTDYAAACWLDVPERVDMAFDTFHAKTISGKIWRPEVRALGYRGAQDSA